MFHCVNKKGKAGTIDRASETRPGDSNDNAGDPGAPAFFDRITEANLFQGFVATKAEGSFRSEIGAVPRRNRIF